MPNKNKTVALFKGQETGAESPNSRDLKITTSPHEVHTGVSPDYALAECSESSAILSDHHIQHPIQTASSTDNVEEAVWFLMRASYGREQKAKAYLEACGIEVFLPLQKKCFERNGKRIHKLQSLIPNFLFVKSTEKEMKKYIGKEPLAFFHHYYVPHGRISGGGKMGKT